MSNLQRHTIDVGIDLGTTNSAVAVMVDGQPLCVPNNLNRFTTPSVVRVRPNGALDVGDNAYQQLAYAPGDTTSEFKRLMGTPNRFTFERARNAMSPAELSAEVLKALKGDIHTRHGLDARAAVITVPAAFELTQCAATQDAAALAGFMQSPLLQEPVAASLAYGYGADRGVGSWLVYDLGGGTFDLALVTVRDGRIEVLDHEGDNHLGGKDLDWIVVERLLVPRLAQSYDVRSFTRANANRRRELSILKSKAEEAKVALSVSDSATITIEPGRAPFEDDRGDEIETDIVIQRVDYEREIADFVSRSIGFSRRLLARHPAVAVESVLLVGGPTLTPYLRKRLAEDLGLALNTAIDPMTAVATGAAVYASTMPLDAAARVVTPKPGEAAGSPGREADLRFAAVTDAEQTPVGVTVHEPDAVTIEVVTSDNRWTSGRVPLRNGSAVVSVPLLHRGQNGFALQAFDGTGVPTKPAAQPFTIGRGLTASAAPLSRTLGVVVRDENSGRRKVEQLLLKDTPLPARAEHDFRTTLALEPGGEMEVISVFLVEGEALRPERNRVVGHIDITDRNVSRRVPAGSPITVTIEVSTSRLLTATVFLPLTDQAFTMPIVMQSEDVTPRELVQDLLLERERIEAASPQLNGTEIRELNLAADDVAKKVRAAEGDDHDARQQGLMALKELQQRLDEVDETFEIPRAIEEAREEISAAESAVSAMGTDAQRQRLARGVDALEEAIKSRNAPLIERERSRLARLRFEVLAAQPWFWREWFEHLESDVIDWTDQMEAARLKREGRDALIRGDVDQLRWTTIALSNLAPTDPRSFANVELR